MSKHNQTHLNQLCLNVKCVHIAQEEKVIMNVLIVKKHVMEPKPKESYRKDLKTAGSVTGALHRLM